MQFGLLSTCLVTWKRLPPGKITWESPEIRWGRLLNQLRLWITMHDSYVCLFHWGGLFPLLTSSSQKLFELIVRTPLCNAHFAAVLWQRLKKPLSQLEDATCIERCLYLHECDYAIQYLSSTRKHTHTHISVYLSMYRNYLSGCHIDKGSKQQTWAGISGKKWW